MSMNVLLKTLLKNCSTFMHCNYIWSSTMDKTGTSTLLSAQYKHKCTIFPFFNINKDELKLTDGKKNKIYKSLMLLFTHTHTHKENEGSEKKMS